MIAGLVLNFVGEIKIPGDSNQSLKLLVVMQNLFQSQSLENSEEVEPQINSVTSETDIVMLTTGANNANYEQLTKKCFIEGLTGGSEQSCTDTSNDSVKYIASGFANDYEKFLMNIAQKMKADGMIVVVAYPFLAL